MMYHIQEKMQYFYINGICNNGEAGLSLFLLIKMISVSKAIYLPASKHTVMISLQPYKEITCRLSSKIRKLFWKLCSFILYNLIIAIRNTQLVMTAYFHFKTHGTGIFFPSVFVCFFQGRTCLVTMSK